MKVYVLFQTLDYENPIAEEIFTTVEAAVNYLKSRVDTDVSVMGLRTRIDDSETIYELYHRAITGISTEHVARYYTKEYEVQG